MKHVGKMKNNGARIVIAYRTIPGDPLSALVVGTNQLQDSYHDSLMSLVESDTGQQADELADVMAVRRFPDGSNMLQFVHANGMLQKVPTAGVIITPDNKTSIPLDELNNVIAEQKGVTLEQLAIKDGSNSTVPTISEKASAKSATEEVVIETSKSEVDLSPTEMRSRADALYKEAAKLRKTADELDPPKSKKATKETV
jgi:ABC-type sulfate/molybdate transport systems ATPase subunit